MTSKITDFRHPWFDINQEACPKSTVAKPMNMIHEWHLYQNITQHHTKTPPKHKIDRTTWLVGRN